MRVNSSINDQFIAFSSELFARVTIRISRTKIAIKSDACALRDRQSRKPRQTITLKVQQGSQLLANFTKASLIVPETQAVARLLMEHPDQLAYLVDHPQHIEAAIEEILRYNTPFICMRRTAIQDVELGGQSIRKGDKVILHYSTVNHDETVFGADATTFNIHRAINGDVAKQLRSFGIGQHFCIGSHLARMELHVMFKEIIPRLKNPRLSGPISYTRSYFVNAIKSMPIVFEA